MRLANGLSGLGKWWAKQSSMISKAFQLYFYINVEPSLKMMDAYLSKVNLYLAGRDEIFIGLNAEERDISLTTLRKRTSLGQIVHDSFSKQINELIEKKESLESKIESLKKKLGSLKQNIVM